MCPTVYLENALRVLDNGIPVGLTGSIGLLVRFVEGDRIGAATADDYPKSWIDEAGFRSPAREFDEFLAE